MLPRLQVEKLAQHFADGPHHHRQQQDNRREEIFDHPISQRKIESSVLVRPIAKVEATPSTLEVGVCDEVRQLLGRVATSDMAPAGYCILDEIRANASTTTKFE